MKIITIGGGEISELETLELDYFICQQTGKAKPKALFIPTASGDADGYCRTFQNIYGERLGCKVDFLLATKSNFSQQDAMQQILSADLVYIGGGNTQKMLSIWRDYGIDVALRQAAQNGTVLSGLSAGAICWYDAGLSDSDRFTASEGTSWSLKRLEALGFVAGVFCPHLDKEQRHEPLLNLVRASRERSIACDNGAAIFWENGVARVLTSLPNAYAYIYSEQFGEVRVDRFSSGDRLPL
ncbi:Type 1 glutamine amidotransferase-like domain-containing protein [Pseudomonas sp. EL_65y_Pfl2_R95]|uniref:Type 1 glutamine amidotransferase-like domain-containing protein n=1 Tax=Pseudomonas sp. EL_65y_Pfl2_R95 TaxID=3088698 RepID=UPI0030DD3CB5